jgi:hypothetical protein
MKDVNSDLLANSHIRVGGRTISLLRVLNIRRACDVRQIEIRKAEHLVSDHSLLKLKFLLQI